jgi:hypothetical protein
VTIREHADLRACRMSLLAVAVRVTMGFYFSHHRLHTFSGTDTVQYLDRRGIKRPEHEADHSPHLVPRLKKRMALLSFT